MPTTYPNGAGEMLGDIVATCVPLQTSGSLRFVRHTGTDGGGNTGTDKENPMATLGAAVAASSNNDVIILLDGHTETLSVAVGLLQGMSVIGSGLSGGRPTVKLTNAVENSMLTVAATGVEIANIWFEESTLSDVGAKVLVSSAGFVMRGCYFEQNVNDAVAALQFNAGGDDASIRNTTFISTATVVASRPARAIRVAAAISDMELEGVVISSGTVGYSGIAFDNTAAAITRFRARSSSLLLGANQSLHSSTVGYNNVQTATGGAQVSW